MILIGFLATAVVTGKDDGLLYGGGFSLLGRQALAAVVVTVYAFGVTWLVAKVIDRTMGFRVQSGDERSGLDLIVHGETAYELSMAAVGHLATVTGRSGADAAEEPRRTEVPAAVADKEGEPRSD
jgi:Amt family ammonium transporter